MAVVLGVRLVPMY